jgi:hypothetical protein
MTKESILGKPRKSLLSKGYFGTNQEVLAAVWIFKVRQCLPLVSKNWANFKIQKVG